MPEKIYDHVIIGSGMGGLACAYILAAEGFKVIVLEKNHQIGGSLQVFSRDKTIFDTGVHYIGGLDEGQNLNQFFKYFKILDKLKLRRMRPEAFDKIHFGEEDKMYSYAQGYEAFTASLSADFPEEKEGIEAFAAKIQEVCKLFPLYQLEDHAVDNYMDNEYLSINTRDYIKTFTDNERLQNVLGASNLLYAGEGDKTPFYVHALIVNSFIESSYRLENGGSQIAIQMAKNITELGGEVKRRCAVISAEYEDGKNISAVVLSSGEKVYGNNFISNIHPQNTIPLFGRKHFRNAYVNRIEAIKNTKSSFNVCLVLKKDTFKYLDYNIYHLDDDDAWDSVNYNKESWPESMFINTPLVANQGKYSDGLSILVYMDYEEVKEWADTENTVGKPGARPQAYLDFKKRKEEQVIKKVEKLFPDIRSKIKGVYSSTPLTFRDYIGNNDGSLYGMQKDYKSFMTTFVKPKTRIPNLYLTGQNMNLHGILGVTISAFVTCFEFIDKKELLDKVKNT